jgi:hypothetical protein
MLKESNIVIPADTDIEGSTDQTTIGETLADGNVTMSGEDYQAWKGGNDDAFNFIANNINVTIL